MNCNASVECDAENQLWYRVVELGLEYGHDKVQIEFDEYSLFLTEPAEKFGRLPSWMEMFQWYPSGTSSAFITFRNMAHWRHLVAKNEN